MGLFSNKKKEHTTFHLNIRFSSAVKGSTQSQTETTIKNWIKDAERCYKDKPALKIHPEWKWNVKGVSNNLSFTTGRELRKFMDDKFDNIVGKSKTEGCLQVLVVDSAKTTKDNQSFAGHSFFPHCVVPFGRKHGIIMDIDALKSTFSHELGHFLSLKHTFEPYVGLKKNCNKGYPKGESGKGGTRTGRRINVMDYKRKDSDTTFLNNCQKERAAKQRRMYMTKAGDTNYRKLKGLR
ncbi:MAG TPA: M43 family zinc metalloprotease [Nitrospirales bacterium]|nr:M43 family zinc metalloprotease [Nitrospirales bacterium]